MLGLRDGAKLVTRRGKDWRLDGAKVDGTSCRWLGMAGLIAGVEDGHHHYAEWHLTDEGREALAEWDWVRAKYSGSALPSPP